MRKRGYTTGLLLRHERGHRNGWGDNHAARAALGCSGGDFGWPRSIMRLD
jgi:hypothetical protein